MSIFAIHPLSPILFISPTNSPLLVWFSSTLELLATLNYLFFPSSPLAYPTPEFSNLPPAVSLHSSISPFTSTLCHSLPSPIRLPFTLLIDFDSSPFSPLYFSYNLNHTYVHLFRALYHPLLSGLNHFQYCPPLRHLCT